MLKIGAANFPLLIWVDTDTDFTFHATNTHLTLSTHLSHLTLPLSAKPLCSTSPLYWSSPAIMKNRGTSPLKLTSQLVKVSFEVFNWGFDWELLHSAELGLSVISLNLFTSFFILFFTIYNIFNFVSLFFSELRFNWELGLYCN